MKSCLIPNTVGAAHVVPAKAHVLPLAIAAFGCVCLVGTGVGVAADEIVLFDAATTPLAAVVSQSGGEVRVAQAACWRSRPRARPDFRECSSRAPGTSRNATGSRSNWRTATAKANCRSPSGWTIPDANPGKSQGVFLDRVKIRGKQPASYTVALPPPLPHAREINASSPA